MNDRLGVDNRVLNRTLNPKTLEFQSPLGIIECLAILILRFQKGKKVFIAVYPTFSDSSWVEWQIDRD
jgi:hypothetical protein